MFRTRRRLLPAFLLALAAAATPAAAPVPWTAAGNHVRRLVTVEGVVAEATCGGDRRCTLAFDPADPSALRVVLIIPWVTDLPPDPAHLYRGKRVQVTGRVMRFQRRLEMAVTPAQLEVVGLAETAPAAASPPPATVPPATAAVPPPAARPTPTLPPVRAAAPAAVSPPPVAAPAATTPPAAVAAPPAPAPAAPVPAPPPAPLPVARVDPRCAPWREERAAVMGELRALARDLDTCLAAARNGCAALGDRLGPPLSRLDEVEQQLGRACP